MYKFIMIAIALITVSCGAGGAGGGVTPIGSDSSTFLYRESMLGFLDHLAHNLDRSASQSFAGPGTAGGHHTTCYVGGGGRVEIGQRNQSLPLVQVNMAMECGGWNLRPQDFVLDVDQATDRFSYELGMTAIEARSTHSSIGDLRGLNSCTLFLFIDEMYSFFDPDIALHENGSQNAVIDGSAVIGCDDGTTRLSCDWDYVSLNHHDDIVNGC